MLIRSYGLFWRTDEVNWTPGAGNKKAFRLLGRIGKNAGTLRIADFREQRGIYILYGNRGAHYVGLARARGLGTRLKEHLFDEHKEKWDRFSWFGFRPVLQGRDADGLQRLKVMAKMTLGDPWVLIGDVEALLIQAMAVNNKAQMRFHRADRWEQIKRDEVIPYLGRL